LHCFFEFGHFLVDFLLQIFLCHLGFSLLFGNCGGGRLSSFVGYPSANPSSRRKEKASRTEKFCWLLGVAFNLNALTS
jgi:hypothetical protein